MAWGSKTVQSYWHFLTGCGGGEPFSTTQGSVGTFFGQLFLVTKLPVFRSFKTRHFLHLTCSLMETLYVFTPMKKELFKNSLHISKSFGKMSFSPLVFILFYFPFHIDKSNKSKNTFATTRWLHVLQSSFIPCSVIVFIDKILFSRFRGGWIIYHVFCQLQYPWQ